MNAQLYILRSYGILKLVTISVYRVLCSHNDELSSCEIYKYLPITIKNKIDAISRTYSTGACRVSESYVGSVASMISNNRRDIIHNYSYFCPILKREEDGFKKI